METSIAETFRNGTVLVTGSTGLVGKLLMEKLLRSCPVKCIAVLVRSKKATAADQRMVEIYKNPLFDRLRIEKPDFANCIKIIEGDLTKQLLGLSKSDRDWLIENVNFVFHCAATIKFNEPLEIANNLNVQGTKSLLSLAEKMKNLKGFVHVSTAYSHCTREEIREEFYPMAITASELKKRLKEDNKYNIIDDWPNTYCYTKAMTENIISTTKHNLPISVFRPSIIGCTKLEPHSGYLENMNGPSGIVTGTITGILRAIPLDSNRITDIIPADYAINALISVMWDTVIRYQHPSRELIHEKPKIYNYVSSIECPITWDKFIKTLRNYYDEAPPMQSIWYIFYIFYTNLWVGVILRLFLHRIPAAIMDLSLLSVGLKPKMLNMYTKIEEMLDLLYVFTTTQWKFDNSNTKELWSLMSPEDRQTFPYSFDGFEWKTYLRSFHYGVREHILKEDLKNLKEAKAKNRRSFWLHQIFICFILYLGFEVCRMFIKYTIYSE